MLMKPLCLLVAFAACILTNNASAQTEYETVKKTFRITYIHPSNIKDTTLAYFPENLPGAIKSGAAGQVISTDTSDGTYSIEIGGGFVVSSDSNGTYVYITCNKKALSDSNYMVKVGDLFIVDIRIPKQDKKSIFYELELSGIRLFRRDNSPLYTFEELAKNDNKKNTDRLIEECLKELKNSYNILQAKTDLGAWYTTPIASGRHKGKTIMEVLKDPKPNDLLPFLAYAREFRLSYRGQQYYLNYPLALWLNGKSPYSSREMLDTLLSYKINSNQFTGFVKEYKDFIIINGFVKNWSFAAMNKQSDNQEKQADAILAITGNVAKLIDDDYSKGLHFLGQAQIYQNRKRYKEAIAACDSGLRYLNPQQYGHFSIELLIKKAICFQNLNQLDQAITTFDKAVATANAPTFNLDGAARGSFIGRIYNLKGDAYKAFEDLIKAAEAYKQSIKAYQEMSSYEAFSLIASVQNSLADVYKSQGEYAYAYDIYKELNNTYSQLFDVKARAENYDKLGFVQFKQGNYQEAIQSHKNAEKTYSALKLYSDAAFSFSSIGQAYWNLGNYDSAIISHNLSLKNADLGKDPSRQAYSWSKLGSLYNLIGDKNKALNAYDSSLYFYEVANDSSGLLTNLSDVGGVYEKDGQYQKAFGYYSRANSVYRKQNNKLELANTYFKMAYTSYNYDTALATKNYLLCYNLAKELGDKSNILYASLNLGILSVRQYNYNRAEKYFDEGLAIAIEQKSKTDEAWVYTKIADGATQKLEYDHAITLYEKAMNIYDSLGDKSQVPWLNSSIGYALGCKGDFTGSLGYYERMKSLGYELKNNAYVASALSSMSFVYSIFGEHKKALAAVDSALQIFVELKNNWQIANTYVTMGSVYSGMGDYQNAIRYHLLSDSMFRVEKDELSRSIPQNNIGVVYFFQADYDKALQYFLEADKLNSVANVVNESVLITRINIGEIHLTKKNYPLATKYLEDANKISRDKKLLRMWGTSSLLLGKLALENNKHQEALKYLMESRNICSKANVIDRVVEADIFLGKTYSQLNNPEAIPSLRSAIALARKIESKYLWEGLYELGLIYYNKGMFDSATIVFKEAVTDVEASGSKLFGGAEAKKLYAADLRKIDLYNKLVAGLAKLNKSEEALFYADKSNSQAIKEKLEQSGIVTTDKEKNEALKKGNELLQKQNAIQQAIAKEKAKPEKERNNELISSLESVKRVAEEDYLNFIDELVAKYEDLKSYFSKTNPADFRNYIDYIPDSTIVILYVINGDQLLIFTVTNQETAIKVVEMKNDINKQASRLLGILKNPENATGTGAVQVRSTIKSKDAIKGDFRIESTLLYNMLITPIADQLAGKKNICVIPNSKLSSIPFAALGTVTENGGFKFLIEDYCLFYTNKMDIFSKPYKARNINASFIAFGNPDKSLPGASQEVNNIKDLYPNTTVYLEDEATEQRAKDGLKSFRYVHFATHGVLDNSNFTNSYILFNKDGANDGKFTLAEINGQIKDETDMIFLSACELAVSQEISKGWDISVLNAFLNNRIRTGVASLWQVPDEATTILLTEFYKNLKTMTRSEALRHAQAVLSQNPKYSHPYNWGAFVMYGEWR
jgi:CHAT domain-containing protein